jgi:hypothetical protein
VAFDSGTDRPDIGVGKRGSDRREGFALFNVTCIASSFFQHPEARKRSGGRCRWAKDVDFINVGKDQTTKEVSRQGFKDV